jgi:YbbR domain-containing protein
MRKTRTLKIKLLFERLVSHWPAKVLSLTAAVLLFVFNRASNLVEQDFELPLEVVVPEMLAVAAPFQQRVSITVRSEDEEAISDISSGDFRAYVDLTDFRSEGAYRVPVRYTRTGFALNSAAFVDRVEPCPLPLS